MLASGSCYCRITKDGFTLFGRRRRIFMSLVRRRGREAGCLPILSRNFSDALTLVSFPVQRLSTTCYQ